MAVKVAGLLLVLGCLTVHQEQRWANNLTLWASAAAVNTTAPRPAYNYAVALRQAHAYDQAAFWLVLASQRSVGHPRGAEFRRLIQAQFGALESEGFPICDSPSARPYCF